jgi:hypothetical protein
MTDYRNEDFNYRGPEDPFRHDAKPDPDVRTANAAWGWIAAAVFLVVILAVAFDIGHQPGGAGTNTASNELSPPAAARMMPPANILPPTATPSPAAPQSIVPAPGAPAQGNGG